AADLRGAQRSGLEHRGARGKLLEQNIRLIKNLAEPGLIEPHGAEHELRAQVRVFARHLGPQLRIVAARPDRAYLQGALFDRLARGLHARVPPDLAADRLPQPLRRLVALLGPGGAVVGIEAEIGIAAFARRAV